MGDGVDGPRRHRLCQNEVVADLKQRGPSGAHRLYVTELAGAETKAAIKFPFEAEGCKPDVLELRIGAGGRSQLSGCVRFGTDFGLGLGLFSPIGFFLKRQ
jgi:hypothetical protein